MPLPHATAGRGFVSYAKSSNKPLRYLYHAELRSAIQRVSIPHFTEKYFKVLRMGEEGLRLDLPI